MTRYWAKAPDLLRSRPDDEPEDGFTEITREQYKAAIEVLTDPEDKRLLSLEGGVFGLVASPEPVQRDEGVTD